MKEASNQRASAQTVTAMFKALGDPTRLRIFDCLRSCCGAVSVDEGGSIRPIKGPTVGQVCCRVTGAEKITSTISFHLKELRNAGLIRMEKRGKHMICAIAPDAIRAMTNYLTREGSDCCNGEQP